MDTDTLKQLVRNIVSQASALKDKYTTELNAPVNYACIFAQSDGEYKELTEAVQAIGQVVKQTDSGLLYHIADLKTVAGILRILKIRIPDPTRPERGDADFTVSDYSSFKKEYLSRPGFKLITRPDMEMIELMEQNCTVRVYFSYPTVEQQLFGS